MLRSALVVLATLLSFHIATADNTPECLDRLDQLIGNRLNIVETGMDDGQPLSMSFYHFNRSAESVAAYGVKNGQSGYRHMDGAQIQIEDCRLRRGRISFKVRGVTIRQESNTTFSGSWGVWPANWHSTFEIQN